MKLTGRTALVTGAGRGIGRAIAKGLAQEGAQVVLVARTQAQLEAVAQEIRGAGGRALPIVADATDEAAINKAVEKAYAEFGAIDILVNNAGGNQLGPFVDSDPKQWWAQVELNLRGPYLCTRAVAPRMVERKWGRIINIASVMAKVGTPFGSAYAAGKHGLVGLTRALAAELAPHGVTVNAVCPGYVITDLTDETFAQRAKLFGTTVETIRENVLRAIPQRSAMTPEEVVPSVLFFASPEGYRTTGEAMNVSGGMVMH